jgi:multicomponent Na+:H+ antiporter subunit A
LGEPQAAILSLFGQNEWLDCERLDGRFEVNFSFMDIAAIVLSGFVLAFLSPAVYAAARQWTGWLLALLPATVTLYLGLVYLPPVSAGEVWAITYPWVASLDVSFSFYLDGLSLTFALLISGIGTLILIYAGDYLAKYPQINHFYLYMLLFMASMLGVVLAGNLITLFLFWELTSLSSYLLIGFHYHKEASRAAALQALLVTGAGGLALLAGFILLGMAGGSFELATLLEQGELVRGHSFYGPLLLLVLLGAFTKSAQFPFHFWLPGAMEAPTPVSAYLHSATMVKAGIYLLARLSPVLAGTTAWSTAVIGVGALTMLLGALVALQQTDLKRILAYSTVSALGTLVMLLGIGSKTAVEAAMIFLVVHSLYKGTLFLVAGILDHQTGTRDVTQMGGLGRLMPITATATLLAGLSMAGLPPLLGFLSKELLYEATLALGDYALWLTGAVLLANGIMVAVALTLFIRPFTGRLGNTPRQPQRETAVSLWLGPLLLAGLGLLLGLLVGIFPYLMSNLLAVPQVTAVLGQPVTLELALWHGLTPMLALSGVTLLLGGTIYWQRSPLVSWLSRVDPAGWLGPQRFYQLSLAGLYRLAQWQTAVLQNGRLRIYLLIILSSGAALSGYIFWNSHALALPGNLPPVRFFEAAAAVVILAGVAGVMTQRSRLGAVASLGVVGYGVGLIYILFGAPDLAMTQFAIETLVVILFMLVLYRLPHFAVLATWPVRARDAAVSLTVGGMFTLLVLTVAALPPQLRLKTYFIENSLLVAKGRNVVNVILVDFRGLDTMGEITVLAIAAIGVYALLKLRLDDRKKE